jgi:hypothetical protein
MLCVSGAREGEQAKARERKYARRGADKQETTPL